MQQLEFQLRGEFVELNQLLKLAVVCDSHVGCARAPNFLGENIFVACSGAQAHPT